MKALLARIDAYEKLIRLDRPIGILLLLWPTLWGLWIARGTVPDWKVLWIFVFGTVLMRSAGCALNDWADRKYDGLVERTRDRPLAAGAIRPWEALAVAAVLALAAFAMVLKLNRLTIELSFVALALATVYPFLKRFFWMPQAWLGVAFGFGIPMAFAAHWNEVPPLAWALLGANVAWTIAYDTQYAMVDRDDDVKLGLKTSAILFGRRDVAAVMIFHALFLLSLVAIGFWQGFGLLFWAGLQVAAFLVAWQFRLIKDRSRDGCFRAFKNNNWIGAAVFAGIALDLWQRSLP